MPMKGIILSGGSGTRLYPLTRFYNKHLIGVFDKPMIYYPLSTLMLADIREILIISDEKTIQLYRCIFGNGSKLGVVIDYAIQQKPRGIADAFNVGAKFIGEDSVTLILGDNIFYGKLDFFRAALRNNAGATIFAYYVKDPERYGVVEFTSSGKISSLEEKPTVPKSNFAIPGLYVYDNKVLDIAENIRPSSRGELEITDVNREYLRLKRLDVVKLGRGIAWFDTGTPDKLLDASNFISAIQQRQNLIIACLEEIAYNRGYINKEMFIKNVEEIPPSYYRNYLKVILNEL